VVSRTGGLKLSNIGTGNKTGPNKVQMRQEVRVICPNCGTHVPDGIGICPACHAELALTTVIPRIKGAYCQSCGALIPEGEKSCPSCGMPVSRETLPVRLDQAAAHMARIESQDEEPEEDEPRPPAHAIEDLPEIEDEAGEEEETHAMARIESAIPSEPEPYDPTLGGERMPQARALMTAAFAALFIVGGAAYYIAHPWDPDAFSTKATVPADTSSVGYPGEIDTLQGQDSSSGNNDVIAGDAATYQQLLEAWQQLGEFNESLQAREEALRTDGVSADADTRANGQAQMQETTLELSNLITSLETVDVTSGTYAETLEHVNTLGSWLRNWADQLSEAWDLSVASEDPEASQEEILAPLTQNMTEGGTNTYASLFAENYVDWMPTEGAGQDDG